MICALANIRAVLLSVILALAAATAAWPQSGDASPAPGWETAVEQAADLLGDEETPTPDLEAARDRLLRLRSGAIESEASANARLQDVNARLAALGPAPADGASESPEIAQRRAQIGQELSLAQVPVLEAQDFQRRADALIREIDKVVRARFAAELRSLGPTPLRPLHWVQALGAVTENLQVERRSLLTTWANPASQALILRRVPLDLALALAGIAIAFSFGRRLAAWTEAALARETRVRAIALLVNLRNFSRLIVPAVGAGLLFAALDPFEAADPGAEAVIFDLPGFVLAYIAAGWIGASVFAPKLPAYRLTPLNDVDAARGAHLSLGLGAVFAVHLFIRRFSADWSLTLAEAAVIVYPLFLVGGVLLWQVSRLLRTIRRAIVARNRGVQAGERTGAITLGVLTTTERGAWTIAMLAPVLASVGFLAAANFLLYGAILTLGVLGAGVVLFDLATTTLGAVGRPKGEAGDHAANEGLVPVLVAAMLALAALPILALVWGARPSDIAGVWFLMRDGVTLGGMRISFAMVVSFTIVFGILYGLAKLLQSILRSTVLPRTRLDAGGKNAILAGVGYAGFFLAVIAAVSSTGIDLTSLAFVAGALSVGIGFGLQNIVSNFVSGIILLVERPIKEGDWIEVGGHMGYVRGISVRSTEIETFDRASVILPNSDLVAGTVLNRTHTGMSGRLTVPVGVSYASDARQVERVLTAIAEDHPMVLMDPAPRVLFMGFGADSLNFEIRCWLRDVNFSLSARSDINFEILARFREEGISIPFPQRELRFKAGELRDSFHAALRVLSAPGEAAVDAEDAEAPKPRAVQET